MSKPRVSDEHLATMIAKQNDSSIFLDDLLDLHDLRAAIRSRIKLVRSEPIAPDGEAKAAQLARHDMADWMELLLPKDGE